MSAPKAFQRATIECVLRAFDRRRRVRRFLVADEVGLGKTVVARGVIENMMRRKRSRDPLRVFYVCSSLTIAAQNKGSLLKAIPDPETRDRAACDVDRLTLAPNRMLPEDVPLHLYTLTPDTSIPDRRGKHRSGTARERALLHNLLAAKYPSLTQIRGQGEWLRRNARASWGDWKRSSECKPSASLKRAFFPVLREQLGLEPSQHLPPGIRRELDKDPLETIKLLRIALAKTGLDVLAPDLVIFDEFQRFQDLLDGDDRGSDIAREMVRTGREGRAVLLLSATPYRLYGGDLDHLFGEDRHHEQFFKLVEWLFGGDEVAGSRRQELECLFRKYGDALRSADPGGATTRNVKARIEELLRMVIARTERFGHDAGQDAAELSDDVPAPLNTGDLQTFRHMVNCFRNDAEKRVSGAAAVAYWSSVPLPMQALGPDYKAWKSARRSPPKKKVLRLTKTDVARLRGPAEWPHPKLRAMCERFQPEKLAVPWLAPSMPWWPLGGRWAGVVPSEKILLFSRFRAVPRAVAGLMSYDLERYLLRRSGLRFRDVTKRSPLGPQRENLAYFHPSAALARLIDPWRWKAESVKALARYAAEEMEAALIRLGVEIRGRGGRSRTLPELLVLLERRLDAWSSSLEAWRRLAESVARTEDAGGTSLRVRVDQWNAAVHGTLDVVDPREIRTLADAAVSSPGAVLARSLERHRLIPDGSAATCRALRASWEGLRSYLNNPWMNASTGDRDDYRDRISKAILDGNLEAVLDEHLWVTGTLRHSSPEALAEQLTTALSLRTSDVKLYGLEGRQSDYHLRSHAVLAFNQAVRRHRPDADEGKEPAVRTEEVRNAFNSPFWPHVLATTSVGQEGLDFHTWCSAIAHWDLPSNPVDLEQREGRIDRYAGLAIRRVLASKFAPDRAAVESGCSPWEALADRATQTYEDDPAGLAPWWIVGGARVRRLVFDVPLSEARARFEALRQQRLLYRLTLGQPDQGDLVRALRGRISSEDAIAATINLSPWRSGVNEP